MTYGWDREVQAMLVKLRDNETQGIQIGTQTQEKTQESRRQKAAGKQQKRTTVFAGDLPLNKDSITLRRQQAQKMAMQFVQDAWNSDRKADQSIEEYQARAEEQKRELQLNEDKINECRSRKENLRTGYGVEADSQEQKDLELLERKYYPGEYSQGFTEEEQQRLEELETKPRTEYQQRCLEIDGEEQVFQNRAENARTAIKAYNDAVSSMKLERLKFHKMTDAQNNADKVMEQAGKEIQNMIVGEAKDHVDETYEEQREAAEKEAEEKEAQEEKIELRKEQKELMEARIEEAQQENEDAGAAGRERERDAREEAALLKDMADAGLNVAGADGAAKAEVKDILNKLKLIEADIKGIKVDEEI